MLIELKYCSSLSHGVRLGQNWGHFSKNGLSSVWKIFSRPREWICYWSGLELKERISGQLSPYSTSPSPWLLLGLRRDLYDTYWTFSVRSSHSLQSAILLKMPSTWWGVSIVATLISSSLTTACARISGEMWDRSEPMMSNLLSLMSSLLSSTGHKSDREGWKRECYE